EHRPQRKRTRRRAGRWDRIPGEGGRWIHVGHGWRKLARVGRRRSRERFGGRADVGRARAKRASCKKTAEAVCIRASKSAVIPTLPATASRIGSLWGIVAAPWCE